MVASCPWAVEHTTSTLEIEVTRKPHRLWNGVMDVVFTHGAGSDMHQETVMARLVTPDPRRQQADGPIEVWEFDMLMRDAPGSSGLLGEVGSDICRHGEHRRVLEAD